MTRKSVPTSEHGRRAYAGMKRFHDEQSRTVGERLQARLVARGIAANIAPYERVGQ